MSMPWSTAWSTTGSFPQVISFASSRASCARPCWRRWAPPGGPWRTWRPLGCSTNEERPPRPSPGTCSTPNPSATRGRQRVRRGRKEALGRGDRASAFALLSKALSVCPEGAGPQLLLDLAYASAEVDLEAATRHLRRAIELGADPGEAASVALTLAGAIADGEEAPAVLGLLDEVAARLPHTSRDLRIEIEVAVADMTRAAARAPVPAAWLPASWSPHRPRRPHRPHRP